MHCTFQIFYKDFEYWKYAVDVLKDLEKSCSYLPRFQIRCIQIDASSPLNLSFTICKKDEKGIEQDIARFVIDKQLRGEQ